MKSPLPLLLAAGAAFMLMRGGKKSEGAAQSELRNLFVLKAGDTPEQISQMWGLPAIVFGSNKIKASVLRESVRQAAIDNPDIGFAIIGAEDFDALVEVFGHTNDNVPRVVLAAMRTKQQFDLNIMDISEGLPTSQDLVTAVLAGVAFIRQSDSSAPTANNRGFAPAPTQMASLAPIGTFSLSNNSMANETEAPGVVDMVISAVGTGRSVR
jgi:hypothetical protein